MGASCYSLKLQSKVKAQFEETWDTRRKSRVSFLETWEYSTKACSTWSASHCCVTKVKGQSQTQPCILSNLEAKDSMSLLESYLAEECADDQRPWQQSFSWISVNACMEHCNSSFDIIEENFESNLGTTEGLCKLQSADSDEGNTPKIVFLNWKSHRRGVSKPSATLTISSPRSAWGSSSQSSKFAPTPITEVIPDKLYLGCESRAFNDDELLTLGITHILSVTNHINPIEGIEDEHFVMHDRGRTELKKVLKKVYPFMKRAQKPNKKLFVHCKLGQNRSATVVIAFLMKSKGLTLYEAHKMLKELRPLIQIHCNYAKMLLQLDMELFGEASLPDDWMELDKVDYSTGVVSYKNEELTSDQQEMFMTSKKLKL